MLSECFKAVPWLSVPQACLYVDEAVECVRVAGLAFVCRCLSVVVLG